MKLEYYYNQQSSAKMRDDLSLLIPASVNRFFDSSKYSHLELKVDEYSLMKKANLSKHQAERTIDNYARSFVESVIVIEGYWFFFVTSLPTFIQKNLQIDDCADYSKV
ncbi:hypothetical protein PS15m_009679 [Mucor circinelloides]